MTDVLSTICGACKHVPCDCEATMPTIYSEAERDDFERYMRENFPERMLDRWGYTYRDGKVRDRWIGWCGRALTKRTSAHRA